MLGEAEPCIIHNPIHSLMSVVRPHRQWRSEGERREERTLALNDGAFTFNLADAALGDIGVAPGPCPCPCPCPLPFAPACPDPDAVTLTGGVPALDVDAPLAPAAFFPPAPEPAPPRAPLNGGIAAMNIDIFFGAPAPGSVGLIVGVAELDAAPPFCVAAPPLPTRWSPILLATVLLAGIWPPFAAPPLPVRPSPPAPPAAPAPAPAPPGTPLGAKTPRDAVAGVDAPIARASVLSASFLAFSLIAFCFSSSLARMGTRSSGMGLLSCGIQA